MWCIDHKFGELLDGVEVKTLIISLNDSSLVTMKVMLMMNKDLYLIILE